jgi:hypothetical protein
MVARGTPCQATTGGAAAAAVSRVDFTFTRKLPPPAAVPGWINSGRGAANSTPSPLYLQPPPPPPLGGQPGGAVPASIEEVLAEFQGILNPKGDLHKTSADVAHHLQTRGPPNASKFQRLDAEKLAIAKKEFMAL